MLFLFVQASLLIVAKPFYACFCTSCVPRKPRSEISQVRWWRSWYALVRCGTRWNRFGELKREVKWLVRLTFRKNVNGVGRFLPHTKPPLPKEKTPITNFYTTAEIKGKYNIQKSWLYKIAKEHNIPRTFNRGITEWYSVAELQEKFGVTLSAMSKCFFE